MSVFVFDDRVPTPCRNGCTGGVDDVSKLDIECKLHLLNPGGGAAEAWKIITRYAVQTFW